MTMIYLETLFTHHKKPTLLREQLHQHFFKPYEDLSAFTQGLFYPLEALFQETLPSLVLSLHFVGQALFTASRTLGFLLLAHFKECGKERDNTLNALLLATLSLINAVLAPVFEAVRFLTRWGATVAAQLSTTPEKPLSKTNGCAI
jgi:hypothetical protein